MSKKNVQVTNLDNAATHEEVLKALKDLYADKQITDLQLYKGIVGVAADMAKEGDIMLAMTTLALAPPEYFQLVQLRELENDPLYAEVAGGLAAMLVRYGLDKDVRYSPTQGMGEA